MNPFEIATADIFDNPDFIDTAKIGGASVPAIPSEIVEAPVVTEFGLDEGVSFFLRVRRSDLPEPRRNDLVEFHGDEYRVASFSIDASGLVWKINLKSRSSR